MRWFVGICVFFVLASRIFASPSRWLGVLLFADSPVTTSSRNLDLGLSDLGTHMFRVDYYWSRAEPVRRVHFRPTDPLYEPLTFTKQQDQGLENAIAPSPNEQRAATKIFPTLYVGLEWMNCPTHDPLASSTPLDTECGYTTSENAAKSKPPSDLSRSAPWNSTYGYHERYYYFVREFVQHYLAQYPDQIIGITIENEQNSTALFFDGYKEQYIRLLKTANKAIKDTLIELNLPPNTLIVTDGGVVGDTWGGCIAKDWRDRSAKSNTEIITSTNAFYIRQIESGKYNAGLYASGDPSVIDTMSDVNEFIAYVDKPDKYTEFQCDKVFYYLRNYGSTTDGTSDIVASDSLNFHLYQGYEAIRMIQDWLLEQKTRYALPQTILTNEIGLWNYDPIVNYPSTPTYAQDVFRTIIFAKAHAIHPIIWYSNDTYANGGTEVRALGLVEPPETRLAARAYKAIADTLSQETAIQLVSDGQNGIYDYRFAESPTLIHEFAWGTTTLPAPFTGTVGAAIYDSTGTLIRTQTSGFPVTLTSTEPVYIRWSLAQSYVVPIPATIFGFNNVLGQLGAVHDGTNPLPADINSDGRVTVADLLLLLLNW